MKNSKDIIEKIIKDNFLGIHADDIENKMSKVKYMDYSIAEPLKEKGMNTINVNLKEKVIKLGNFNISAAVTREQIELLKHNFNLDGNNLILNVLQDEFKVSLNKEIIKIINKNCKQIGEYKKEIIKYPLPFWKKMLNNIFSFLFKTTIYKEETKDKIITDLVELFPTQYETISDRNKLFKNKLLTLMNKYYAEYRFGKPNFMIVNSKLGAVLMDLEDMKTVKLEDSVLNSNTSIYKQGKIFDMDIYVDPYMKWTDNYLYIGRNDEIDKGSLIILYDKDSINFSELIAEETMAPKFTLDLKLAIDKINNRYKFYKINYKDFEF